MLIRTIYIGTFPVLAIRVQFPQYKSGIVVCSLVPVIGVAMCSSVLWMVILHPSMVLGARPADPPSGWIFGPGPGPPPIEYQHAPWFAYPSRISNGTEMPGENETPDFRIEEDAWLAYESTFSKEHERPYRFSPHYKQSSRFDYNTRWWWRHLFHASTWGCYCTTVYKRLTVLAGCAVLTTRHILTTATSTELVLKRYRHRYHLEDILGAWYDHDADVWNSSVYMAPSRIHYHPRFLGPDATNLTHPLPFTFDLAVWAATRNFFHTLLTIGNDVVTCTRGGPHWWEQVSSTPRYDDLAVVCGFQYIKAGRKNPMPWFKYCTQTKATVVPCPKTEWGWFHCLSGDVWGKYGVESGAAWHRCLKDQYWIYDGLIGMCAFSLHLRSSHLTHYFTVINTHPVLDFIYNSYMGYLPYEWLDGRFLNSKGAAPWYKWRWGFFFQPGLPDHNVYGDELYYKTWLPWYK